MDSSNINPLALLFLAVMCVVVLRGSRQAAVTAILITTAFVPLGQQIVFFGLHLYFMRILILFGFTRLFFRRETAGFTFARVDKFFIWWVLVGVICGILRGPTLETFGTAYDCLGIYFIFRVLIREGTDALAHLRTLIYISLIMAGCMLYESVTHHNLFYLLGGVPEIASERAGRFRAQGPFRHSILAGTFGATLLPLLIGLWFQRSVSKRLCQMGILACMVITFTSASSGPIMSFLAALGGLMLWPMRERMHLIRRGIVLTFIGFGLVMNAPVWYLISRVSDIIGGTGWYRSYLIDQAVKHFGEWWLIGSNYTAHWAPSTSDVLAFDSNNTDITNHYIVQGLRGGILMLVLFIATIVVSFKTIGRVVRQSEPAPLHPKLAWAFGVALASHCTAFISVSYFDQIKVFWFWLIAVIVAIPLTVGEGAPSGDAQPAREQSDEPLISAATPPKPADSTL